MAAGVRFTKAERALVREVIEELLRSPSDEGREVANSILEKLAASERPKKTTPGIGWVRAAEAMREVLGEQLAMPPHPTQEWLIWMCKRIRTLGLTENDCRVIAKVIVSKGWRPPYSFENLIKGADRYLAEAQLGFPAVVFDSVEPPRRDMGPLGMDEL